MLECTTCKFAKNAFRVYHRLRRDNFEPLWRKASLLQIAKDRFVTWRWPGLKNGTFHIDPLNHKSRAGVLVGADFFQPQAAAQAGLRQGYGCGSRIPVDIPLQPIRRGNERHRVSVSETGTQRPKHQNSRAGPRSWLPQIDRLAALDRLHHLNGSDVFGRDRQRVSVQHHQVGDLANRDRPLGLLVPIHEGRIAGVGLQ